MGEYFVENLFYIIIGLSVLSFIILKIGAKFIGFVARGVFGVSKYIRIKYIAFTI